MRDPRAMLHDFHIIDNMPAELRKLVHEYTLKVVMAARQIAPKLPDGSEDFDQVRIVCEAHRRGMQQKMEAAASGWDIGARLNAGLRKAVGARR